MQSSPHADGDAIDLAVALRRLKGDRELLKTLIGFFFEDAPARLKLLDDACKSMSKDEIVRQAHNLRGMAAPFEAVRFIHVARQIEAMGSPMDPANLAEALDQFHVEYERLAHDLKRLIE